MFCIQPFIKGYNFWKPMIIWHMAKIPRLEKRYSFGFYYWIIFREESHEEVPSSVEKSIQAYKMRYLQMLVLFIHRFNRSKGAGFSWMDISSLTTVLLLIAYLLPNLQSCKTYLLPGSHFNQAILPPSKSTSHSVLIIQFEDSSMYIL